MQQQSRGTDLLESSHLILCQSLCTGQPSGSEQQLHGACASMDRLAEAASCKLLAKRGLPGSRKRCRKGVEEGLASCATAKFKGLACAARCARAGSLCQGLFAEYGSLSAQSAPAKHTQCLRTLLPGKIQRRLSAQGPGPERSTARLQATAHCRPC